MIDKQAFRSPYQLSPKSASVLRNYLGPPNEGPNTTQEASERIHAESVESIPVVVTDLAVVIPEEPIDENEPSTLQIDQLLLDGGAETRLQRLRIEVVDVSDQISVAYSNQPGKDVDAIVKRRIGQGPFRNLLEEIYGVSCCLSGLSNRRLLIASHIVPWSESTGEQKTDPENGLLLSVSWDALFDKGFVSFDENGQLLSSEILDEDTARCLGVSMTVRLPEIMLTEERKKNLSWHRKNYGFET